MLRRSGKQHHIGILERSASSHRIRYLYVIVERHPRKIIHVLPMFLHGSQMFFVYIPDPYAAALSGQHRSQSSPPAARRLSLLWSSFSFPPCSLVSCLSFSQICSSPVPAPLKSLTDVCSVLYEYYHCHARSPYHTNSGCMKYDITGKHAAPSIEPTDILLVIKYTYHYDTPSVSQTP